MNSANSPTYNHHPTVNSGSLLLSYTGPVDSQAINTLLLQIENHTYSSPNSKKKILAISTELLQNILHHGTKNASELPSFSIEETGNRFIISATNFIYKSKVAPLKKRIETLNNYSAEEVKSHYQHILKIGNHTTENAGLGLIDIRRKSDNPILAMFVPASNNQYLFTVKVFI